MDNEKLPIKFFAPREVDELRIEGAGNSEPPKWLLSGDALVQRSTELLTAFNQFSRIIDNRIARKSAVPFVFIAKMCDDSTAKSRRKDITSLFQTTDRSNVIGLTDSDELIVKIDSISQMNEIANRIQDYERNSYAISCLETFWEFEPLVQVNEGEKTYKVKLIDFQDYETNIAMQRQFEHSLLAHKIDFQKTSYASRLPVYKIKNASQAILDGLIEEDDYEMLFSIEPMPKATPHRKLCAENVTAW
ncbi:Uncharacterised protein [uncultured Flavonifractor sp.]|nr:Uncharacterised protein [Flavonifractor plautii]SCJ54884.1 Uncharacterised protein [uncultured Flavonifractor sp.]